MKLAFLTTMNSKVKVGLYVVDGSKCVLDYRHDKKEPRPRWPSVLRGTWGPVWRSDQKKTGSEAGAEAHPNIEKTGRTAACCLTMKSEVQFQSPRRDLSHP